MAHWEAGGALARGKPPGKMLLRGAPKLGYVRSRKQGVWARIKPSKWFLAKTMLRGSAIAALAAMYMHALHKQVDLDDQARRQEQDGYFYCVLKDGYDMFSDAFVDILHSAEGFSKKFYPDNKGVAVGYGYNPTQNSAEYNKGIMDFAGIDEATQALILKNAGKLREADMGRVPEEFKGIRLTEEQINRMALYAKMTYEQDFLQVLADKMDRRGYGAQAKQKALVSYGRMPENEKAVLVHMAYKVGRANLSKYEGFFGNFLEYLDNPTDENRKKVAAGFVYRYKKGGKMLTDDRVGRMHRTAFLGQSPKGAPRPSGAQGLAQAQKAPSAAGQPAELTEDEKYAQASKEVARMMSFGALARYLAQKAEGLARERDEGSAKPAMGKG